MTEGRFVRAGEEDLPALYRFYEEVCAALTDDEYGPDWHIGIYPSREDLAEHIAAGSMYFLLSEGGIISAMALSRREDPMYEDLGWPLPAAPEKICALHLFAVHPSRRGKGISSRMMEEMLRLASEAGKEQIHLDVVKGNLPAEKLYRAFGFRFFTEREICYEDTGAITVRLFYRVL